MELVPTMKEGEVNNNQTTTIPHNLLYVFYMWGEEKGRERCLLIRGLDSFVHGWLSATPCLPSLSKKFSQCPDPVNAHLRPDCHFGSIPEKLSQQVSSFVAKNPRDILATEEEEWVYQPLSPSRGSSLID